MSETALGTQGSTSGTSTPASGTPPPASGGTQASSQGGTQSSLGGGGNSQSTWRDSLPEDIRSHSAISSFKDIESLTKSYIHQSSLVGKKGVVLPGEKATSEEWGQFFNQLGVPDESKYDFKLPDNYKVPNETLSRFKGIFAKSGLLPRQAEAIMAEYAKFESETLQAHEKGTQEAAKEQMENLKKEWGEGYDKNLSAARLAVKEIGGDEFVQYLNETGMGNDVNLIKFAAKAARLMGEDRLREGGVAQNGQTPEEIQAEIAELSSHPAYTDKNHGMHDTIVNKVAGLYKRLTNGR